jgi:hypothetical protein
MAFGVWRSAFGVRRLAVSGFGSGDCPAGTRRYERSVSSVEATGLNEPENPVATLLSAFGVWRLAFGVRRLAVGVVGVVGVSPEGVPKLSPGGRRI